MTEDTPPTRAEVERRWRALIAGETSREDTHRWVKPWVEERWAELEPLVENALQSLHGFDMTCDPQNRNLVRHGGRDEGRPYYHSDRHIEVELDRWLQNLDE